MPGDVPSSVDVDDGRAVEGTVLVLRPPSGGVDGLVLAEDDPVGRPVVADLVEHPALVLPPGAVVVQGPGRGVEAVALDLEARGMVDPVGRTLPGDDSRSF